MADLYIETGMDVIAVVDPVTSQISPRTFKSFLLEPFTELIHSTSASKALSQPSFVCGDATKNIEVMCSDPP